jgi:hypothetical protein
MAGFRASAGARHAEQRPRSARLVREGVDVEWRVEAFREAREIGVKNVSVVFEWHEVFVVVEFVEARSVDEIVKMFGRDVESHVRVVAGLNGVDECNCRVRESFGKELQSDGNAEGVVELDVRV